MIKFKGIDNETANENRVIFEKHGVAIAIDELSTGEKQIVFRGTQLLRNRKTVHEGIILIDEPELSMHPKWQSKVLDYYVDLFAGNNNQIIFTTHSEYVLKSALNRINDCIVIILDNENGRIEQKTVKAPTNRPMLSYAETKYLAFDILSYDYHIELYAYLQSKEGLDTIIEADRFIENSLLFVEKTHKKDSCYCNPKNGSITNYHTLPTYIRNAIDHPDNGNFFSEEELRISTELLIDLCRRKQEW